MEQKNEFPVHYPGRRFTFLGFCLTLLASLTALGGFAQTDDVPQEIKSANISLTGELTTAKDGETVITEKVTEEGAEWLQLTFDDVDLGKNSFLTITATEDGAVQRFDAESLAEWNNTSAYFNGADLTVSLTIMDGDTDVSATIDEIKVGLPQGNIASSQCGPDDDRRSTNDNAVGRLGPTGCTGCIITNGKLVTAGHCIGTVNVVMFNVPKSRPDQSLVFPGPQDQYPITDRVTGDGTAGETDWAVLTAGRNSETGLTPIEGQGKSYNVVQSAPVSPITITGYGSDDGVDNQTLQTHSGPLAGATNSNVTYVLDTTGGNSGSPIIDATGNAVGVHTFGACSTDGGGFNGGTRATVTAFWDAMGLGNNPPPPPPPSGDVATWSSANISGTVIRHIDGQAQIATGDNLGDDGKWKMVSGLAGEGVSFQSVDNPNSYLRHRNAQVWLDPFQDNSLYREDATFFIREGLADSNQSSFESFNFPGRYLRHRNFLMYSEAITSDLARRDATFSKVGEAAQQTSQDTASISETPNAPAVGLYPNPATSNINLKGVAADQNVQIIDFSGRAVLETAPNDGIDIRGLKSGMYFVKMKNGKSIPFIKQ